MVINTELVIYTLPNHDVYHSPTDYIKNNKVIVDESRPDLLMDLSHPWSNVDPATLGTHPHGYKIWYRTWGWLIHQMIILLKKLQRPNLNDSSTSHSWT